MKTKEFEFFLTLWMILPWTDGATLIYDVFTEPYIIPYAKKLKTQMESWVSFIIFTVNSSYLCFVWFIFTSFPEEQRRFFVVVAGTVYPVACSTIALTTKTNKSDVTFWLTYWSCFSTLFVCMDYLENLIGHIRGFYSLCMAVTIYLFLPMFDGANVVFRRVLVPLSGQYENLLILDAWLVRKSIEKSVPSKYHDRVFEKAAHVFVGTPKEKEC
jgi:receptor expression-enhancing protein 5/6